jgi:alpha-beta hydrolase superfamily lysophospholipase
MEIVNYFVPRQYAIYSFDLRGHGHSPGLRGYINRWSELREDMAAFIELVHREQPASPVFVLGHSIGGVIVLDYCLRNPGGISGVICSAPVIGEIGISAFLLMLARVLDRVWPTLSLSTGLDISKLSRDPAVEREARADPLYHSRGTPRLGMEIERTVEWVHAHAGEISLPLLIVHGTDDVLSPIGGSRKFIRKVTYPDARLQEYEGGFHELCHDIIKEQVLADIESWLARHLGA